MTQYKFFWQACLGSGKCPMYAASFKWHSTLQHLPHLSQATGQMLKPELDHRHQAPGPQSDTLTLSLTQTWNSQTLNQGWTHFPQCSVRALSCPLFECTIFTCPKGPKLERFFCKRNRPFGWALAMNNCHTRQYSANVLVVDPVDFLEG